MCVIIYQNANNHDAEPSAAQDLMLASQLTEVISTQATVSELKERVRAQYQRMHALLEADQAETARTLGDALATCVRKTAQPVLLLKEKRREAEKLRRSLQAFLQRSGSLSFMKVRRAEQSSQWWLCLTSQLSHLVRVLFLKIILLTRT